MREHFFKAEKREEQRDEPKETPARAEDFSASDAPPGDREGGPKTVPADEFARLTAEKEELAATLVRRQADFDNYRKRIERERKDEARRSNARLIQELLPVVDGFERALAAHPAHDDYRKGIELIYRNLWDTISKQGLERIAAEGKRFDPHYHEAIERVETHDYPDGTILQVVQEGYLFDGRVLRPSLVRVAAAPEGTDGDKASAEHSQVH